MNEGSEVHSPFIDNKLTTAGSGPGQVLLGGVDVGEDWHGGDDETQDPRWENQGNHNISTEKVCREV